MEAIKKFQTVLTPPPFSPIVLDTPFSGRRSGEKVEKRVPGSPAGYHPQLESPALWIRQTGLDHYSMVTNYFKIATYYCKSEFKELYVCQLWTKVSWISWASSASLLALQRAAFLLLPLCLATELLSFFTQATACTPKTFPTNACQLHCRRGLGRLLLLWIVNLGEGPGPHLAQPGMRISTVLPLAAESNLLWMEPA